MYAQNSNITIREASSDEFEKIGRLNYAIKQEWNDPLFNLLCSEVSAEDWLNFNPIRGKSMTAATGKAKVIIAEDCRTGSIVGLAGISKCDPSFPPKVALHFPPGFNVNEFRKMEGPRLAWKNQLLSMNGGFLCASNKFWTFCATN
jgi:hypothetical protein